MNTVEKKCTCVHEYQDKVYGKGIRLFNVGTKDAKCTVCGSKTHVENNGK